MLTYKIWLSDVSTYLLYNIYHIPHDYINCNWLLCLYYYLMPLNPPCLYHAASVCHYLVSCTGIYGLVLNKRHLPLCNRYLLFSNAVLTGIPSRTGLYKETFVINPHHLLSHSHLTQSHLKLLSLL